MNIYFFIAGILCFLLGIAHSILGEYLIFKNIRNKEKLVPTKETIELKERHVRILWATWHLATVFGWCLGAILIKISILEESQLIDFIVNTIGLTMFLSSLLVLIGTKGKHPGWLVLLAIGIVLIIGT
ncbi:hypothetical protein [Xanthomarina spongicola]|uniref:Uncharacterized protein n=1 Tax=Xanthomarina spongicola TaxID=570520 RepID=A0A316DPH0_9FLAO|nr:hypothetical protein [Xanthomarina spongicola]PWK19865.1 hypothetical protein LX78_01215 [Xanthomarina spongicola]